MEIKDIKVTVEFDGPQARSLGLCIGYYLENELMRYISNEDASGHLEVPDGNTLREYFFEYYAVLINQMRQMWSVLGRYEMFVSRVRVFDKIIDKYDEEHAKKKSVKKRK